MLQAVRSEVQKRLPKEWSEEEIAQLTELWEQLKNDDGNSLKKKERKTTNYLCKILSNKKQPKREEYISYISVYILL